MTSQFVLTEKKDKVGYLILNRPERLNAISDEIVLEIVDAMQGLDKDDEVRVIVCGLVSLVCVLCWAVSIDVTTRLPNYATTEGNAFVR